MRTISQSVSNKGFREMEKKGVFSEHHLRDSKNTGPIQVLLRVRDKILNYKTHYVLVSMHTCRTCCK